VGRVSVPESHPRRGSLYWVHVPDEPADKRRPALVVSPDVRLRVRDGGLLRPSVAECEQITTLRRDRLAPRPLGGGLAASRMVEIEKGILRAIGIPVS